MDTDPLGPRYACGDKRPEPGGEAASKVDKLPPSSITEKSEMSRVIDFR
jgi:hypothetical protein